MRHALSAARTILAVGAMAIAVAAGCKRTSPPSETSIDAGPAPSSVVRGALTPQESAQVLAHVGATTLTLGDFAAALEHMDAFDRVRYQAPDRRKELLAEMIDVQLLADEAREEGLDRDPAVQEEVRQILRDAVLKTAHEHVPSPTEIPLEEVRAEFEAHRSDFHDPERRRVSAIVLTRAPAASAALEAAQKGGASAWGDLVRSRSVEAPPSGDTPDDLAGDLGFVSPPGDPRGTNARIPEEVRAAVFEIAAVGDVLGRVVAAASRFYVVKLATKVDGHDRTFEDVERSLRVKLAGQKIEASEKALLESLRKQYPVEIDEAALQQVAVPPGDAGRP